MLQLRNTTTNKGPLWLVEKKYTIGSDSSCDIKISDSSVAAVHAELLVNGDDVQLHNTSGAKDIEVNGQVLKHSIVLKPGDTLRIGLETLQIVDPKLSKSTVMEAPAASQGWALKALNTALADKHFPLVGTQVIGRSKECDVSLGVVHLSRKHAKVTVTDKGLQVEDLESSNGTFVNGKKVRQATVIAGDELSFDTLRFRVIGPLIDSDKTTVRVSGDGELTTVRPALKVPGQETAAARTAAAGSVQREKSPRPAPTPVSGSSHSAPTSAEQAEPPKSSAALWVGIALVLGALVAWYFLT